MPASAAPMPATAQLRDCVRARSPAGRRRRQVGTDRVVRGDGGHLGSFCSVVLGGAAGRRRGDRAGPDVPGPRDIGAHLRTSIGSVQPTRRRAYHPRSATQPARHPSPRSNDMNAHRTLTAAVLAAAALMVGTGPGLRHAGRRLRRRDDRARARHRPGVPRRGRWARGLREPLRERSATGTSSRWCSATPTPATAGRRSRSARSWTTARSAARSPSTAPRPGSAAPLPRSARRRRSTRCTTTPAT